MHSEYAAGGVLSEVIDGTPKTGQVEVVLMQPNDEQIGVLLFQKVENCAYLSTDDDRALCMNAKLPRQVRCLFVHFLVTVPSLLHHCARSAWINNDRERGVSGKIPQDRNRR